MDKSWIVPEAEPYPRIELSTEELEQSLIRPTPRRIHWISGNAGYDPEKPYVRFFEEEAVQDE